MQKTKLLLIPIIFLFIVVGTFAYSYNETLFYDDFNRYTASGQVVGNDWVETPVGGWEGTNNIPARCYADGTDDCIESQGITTSAEYVTRNISTVGYSSLNLSYMERCDSTGGEYFSVEGYNGAGYEVLRNISASCTGAKNQINFALPVQFLDNSNFDLKYTCGIRGTTGRRCTIDNVNLSGTRYCIKPNETMTINQNEDICKGTYNNVSLTLNKSNTQMVCYYDNINTDSEWSMQQHDLIHTGFNSQIYPITNKFTQLASSSITPSVFSNPILSKGVIYVASGGNNFYALNATTLQTIATYTIPSTLGQIHATPAVANGIVYLNSIDNRTYALNATNLNHIANFTKGGGIYTEYSSPMVWNNIVYTGCRDNKVYALNATNLNHIANFTTGGAITSTLAVANGIVYIGSIDNKVYALNAINLNHIANFTTTGILGTSLSVVNEIVYVSSNDAKLYALNATTLAQIATFQAQWGAISSPAVANGIVYIGSWDNRTYALNATNLNHIANFTSTSRFEIPIISNGVVYIKNWDDTLYALNATNLNHIANITGVAPSYTSPIISNGIVYFSSDKVYALTLMANGTSIEKTKNAEFVNSNININKNNVTLAFCNFNNSNINFNSENSSFISNLLINSVNYIYKNNNFIFNNIFKNSRIDIISSIKNIIYNNTFNDSSIGYGIYIVRSNYTLILNNSFYNIQIPIDFSPDSPYPSYNQIMNNFILSSQNGIVFESGIFNIIKNNFINATLSGIQIDGTENLLNNNIIIGSLNYGAISDGLGNNTLIYSVNGSTLIYNRTNINVNSFNNIHLSNNLVAINSSAEPNLNKPARVTLTNLTYANSQPSILVIPQFTNNTATIIAGNTQCNPPQCVNLSWNNITKTLEFTVTSWSSLTTSNITIVGNTNVQIRDEDTKALILEDATLLDSTALETDEYTTNSGNFALPNLTTGTHRFDISSTNYPQRSYFATINATNLNYTFYLLNGTKGHLVKFNIRDEGGNIVENADVIFTKYISTEGGFVTIQEEDTGILGSVYAYLNPSTNYRIHVIASGFAPKIFDLEPAETEYTILIQRTAQINFYNFLTGVTYNIDPEQGPLKVNSSQNFKMQVSAPGGTLEYFAVSSYFNNTQYLNNITLSPAGGTTQISVDTTGHAKESIVVHYFIKSVGYEDIMDLTKTYLITDTTPSNTSLISIANKYKPEFGSVWSGLIAIFGSVIIGITLFPFVGATGASLVAILSLITFAILGWISLGIVIVSAIVLFGMYLLTGGRE